MHQTINVSGIEANTTYKLTGKMNISTYRGGSVLFRYTIQDESGTTIGKTTEFGEKYTAKTSGEIDFEASFTITEAIAEAKKIKIELMVNDKSTLTVFFNNVSFVNVANPEDELLVNGTFADEVDGVTGTTAGPDNKAAGWTYWNGSAADPADSELVDGGGIKIWASTRKRLTVHQTIKDITPNTVYTFSGYAKTTSVEGGDFKIRCLMQDSAGKTISGYEYDVKVYSTGAGETDWEAFSKDVSCLDANVARIKIEIAAPEGSAVNATVKDFSVIEKIEEPENPPATEPEYTGGKFFNGSFIDAKNTEGEFTPDGIADGWSHYVKNAVAADVAFTTDKGMTITADSTSTAEMLTVHQTVTLDKGKTYTFSGSLNVESTSKGSIEIRHTDPMGGSNKRIEYRTSKTNGWIDMNYVFEVPSDATTNTIKFEIAVSSGATLTASVKDFSLVEKVMPTIQNPAYTTTDVTAIPSWQYYPSGMTHGTDYSAEVSNDAVTLKALTKDIRLMQGVNCTGDLDAVYTLTGQMKAEDLSSGAYVQVRLNNGLDVVATSPTVKGTTATEVNPEGWVDFSITFEVPSKYYSTNDLYYNKDGIVYQDKAPHDITLFKIEQCVTKGTGSASFRNLKVVKGNEITNNTIIGDADNTLIVNGGFDREYADFPRWWTLWESTGGLQATADCENVCVGTVENPVTSQASIHIQNVTPGENSRGTVHQTIKTGYVPSTLPGQAVKLSQWVKTEGFTENKLSIRLQYTVKSGDKPEMTSKYIDVKSTQDWTYYEYLLDIPNADLSTIKLEYMYDEAQGHVWIDEVSMTEYIRATGISADNEKIVLAVGDTADINLSFMPENTTIKEVTCTSSDESVATVTGSGTAYTITAVKEGSAKIKLKHIDGIEKEIAVLVTAGVLEDLPVIDTITTDYETKATGTLPAGYTYSLAAKPQYGTFVIENGNAYTYYPNNQFSGTDTVIVLVEKDGKTALVTVNLEVGSKNEAPVFEEFLVLANKGVAVTGALKATDAEGEALTFEVKEQPGEAGTLEVVIVDGKQCYKFTPAADFTGLDNSGVMQVTDASGNATEAVVRIYVASAGADLRTTVKTEHPRLLADTDKFTSLSELINAEGENNIKLWFNRDVKASTDSLFDSETGVYTPTVWKLSDGVRLDTTGSKNVTKLAFVYMVTDDEKYYEAAILELKALCGDAYIDWNPSHLLDVAMTANGVALAYDWLYNKLSTDNPDVLALVEQALYEKCLVVADSMYDSNHMFVTNENNWNYVCNGGFVTTAMALADHENLDYIEKVDNVLNKAYKSIQYGLPQYAPEGDSIEGVSYWAYGTQYLVSLLASISSATTVENPFLDTPGLDLTALYPIYMTGKAGTYNYADNDMADPVGYLNLWFAEAYKEPSYVWYHKYYMANPNHKASIYDLLYYNPEYYASDEVPELLDYFYTSQAVTAMRHDYDDQDSSFLGFKGGVTGSPHGDLDIGSFVYDIYGIRWAIDMGKDDYNLLGYWELDSEGTRWNYYRKNALGHNTIVFNPEQGGNQTIGQYAAAIEKNLNNPGGGDVILDMTDVYQKNAVDAKRGFAYLNRTQALIRDEFTLKDAGTAYWQMHTYAKVTVAEDGKTATLTQDGKVIELRLFDENGSDYKFETMGAYAYGADGSGAGENANVGITKIFIKATDVQKGVFNVLLTPVDEKSPTIKVLADWNDAENGYDFSTLNADNVEDNEIGAALAGYTLSLEGNIGVNFYMELKQDVASDEEAYMEFTLPDGTTKQVAVKDAVPATQSGKNYYVFTCEVASDEMTGEIQAQFVVDDSTKSPVYTYSVKEYADYIIKNEASYPVKTVALVKAMLNYGAYAQQYFGTNKDALANADLSVEDKFVPSTDEEVLKALLMKYKVSAKSNEILGTFASSYLVLESETTLKVRFRPASEVKAEALTFTVDGKEAKTVMSGNDVIIMIENIKAQDLNKDFVIIASDGTNTLDFSCSTLSYGYVILNVETSEVYNAELKALMCALYNYNQAADTYCGN